MRAYERLIRYAQVETTSNDSTGTHPSTPGQFDLARMLVEEMKELGIADARVDEHCYVYGTLPATPGCERRPALGLIAHMDTSDAASGKDVKPQLVENYAGGDIPLGSSGRVLSPEVYPVLEQLSGHTLITTDGTTLLGADDKGGIADILTAVERIQAENLPHGKLCIGFTPDEEIGEGADLFDVAGFGADYAYTLDGGAAGEIEYQNFNAAAARVEITGVSAHPGSAKNVMVNALTVGMQFNSLLPAAEVPEHTEGTEGFYHLVHMEGTPTAARMDYIIRDHSRTSFVQRKDRMTQAAAFINQTWGEGTVKLTLKDSYYNMEDRIRPHFHLIENARKAAEAVGLVPVTVPVRGGTDGARLSFMGLPCPNLGTGGFNYHGEYEFASVQQMDQVVEMLLQLIALYAQN